MSQFVRFVQESQPARRKTKIWAVMSSPNCHLGRVMWWPAWRRYVYSPGDNVFLDAACLTEVTECLSAETARQKKTWKKRKSKEN